MQNNQHQDLVGFIWNIANKLRGPYRPPQYRRVMLPLIVLRRLDQVLEPTKDEVLTEYARLTSKGLRMPPWKKPSRGWRLVRNALSHFTTPAVLP